MKKYLILIILMSFSGIAFAQYVANTIQQRIQNDQQTIDHDYAEINAMQADINAISNDASADAVTADVPAVEAIQAQQAVASQPVNAQIGLN